MKKPNEVHYNMEEIAQTFAKLKAGDLELPGQRMIIAGNFYTAFSKAVECEDNKITPVEDIWCAGNADIIGLIINSAHDDAHKALNEIGRAWVAAGVKDIENPDESSEWITTLSQDIGNTITKYGYIFNSDATVEETGDPEQAAASEEEKKEEKNENEKPWYKNTTTITIGLGAVAVIAAVGYGAYKMLTDSNDDIWVA